MSGHSEAYDSVPLLGPGFVDAEGLAERQRRVAALAGTGQPGLARDDGGSDTPAGAGHDDSSPVGTGPAGVEAPLGPMLLDPRPDAPAQVNVGWAPEGVVPPRPRVGAGHWIAAGLCVLLASWVVLSLASFVTGLLAQSLTLGVLAVAAVALGVAMLAWGMVLELRAWRSLARVEQLRAVLAHDGTPSQVAREEASAWLDRVGAALPDRASVERMLRGATTAAEVRAVLRSQVTDRLRDAAGKLGRRAAVGGATLVAVCPHPAWDGLLAGVRGLLVVRQVAALYGLRPGVAVTLALLRRVAWTAASTAGISLVSQGAVEQVLGSVPVLKHMAGALTGSAVAVRLYRLAGITARACSPLGHEDI